MNNRYKIEHNHTTGNWRLYIDNIYLLSFGEAEGVYDLENYLNELGEQVDGAETGCAQLTEQVRQQSQELAQLKQKSENDEPKQPDVFCPDCGNVCEFAQTVFDGDSDSGHIYGVDIEYFCDNHDEPLIITEHYNEHNKTPESVTYTCPNCFGYGDIEDSMCLVCEGDETLTVKKYQVIYANGLYYVKNAYTNKYEGVDELLKRHWVDNIECAYPYIIQSEADDAVKYFEAKSPN